VQTPKTIKVGIVEDNPGVRENWAKLLNAQAGLACVGACPSGEAALASLPDARPDVVLMDINLPGMSGIECTARLKLKLPATQILMVTVYTDHEHLFEALKAGASGYLLKCTGREELTHAIVEVMSGGAPMNGRIARRVIEAFRQPTHPPGQDARLSDREQEILGWVARGLVPKDIAPRLNMSYGTVRVHLRHIYDKLHVHSRSEAVAKYMASPERSPNAPRWRADVPVTGPS
jgi:DNA-binding NarL/FixJ family response regulator